MVKMPPGFRGTLPVLSFQKSAFNVSLQGEDWYVPGAGPMAQLPVNELVKRRPDLSEATKFFLPYGPANKSVELFEPTVVKRGLALARGDEDATFRDYASLIYQTKATDYMRKYHKVPPKSFFKDAEDETRKLFMLRLFAAAVAPVQPSFNSPYQLYIDECRRLKRERPP